MTDKIKMKPIQQVNYGSSFFDNISSSYDTKKSNTSYFYESGSTKPGIMLIDTPNMPKV